MQTSVCTINLCKKKYQKILNQIFFLQRLNPCERLRAPGEWPAERLRAPGDYRVNKPIISMQDWFSRSQETVAEPASTNNPNKIRVNLPAVHIVQFHFKNDEPNFDRISIDCQQQQSSISVTNENWLEYSLLYVWRHR